MPSPKSEISILYDAVRNAPTLKGITVLLGSRYLAASGAPPRIVMAPSAGEIKTSRDITSLRDVDRMFAANIWGTNFDHVCELQSRLFQALDEQAQEDPNDPSGNTPGQYWQSVSEDWNTAPDSAKQGEEVTVLFKAIQSISRVPQSFGEIDAVALFPTTVLSAAMGATDTIAHAGTAFGYPNLGVLHIDNEQMSYSGRTANQFTGLTRGLNGTTAAAHASGALVSVTST